MKKLMLTALLALPLFAAELQPTPYLQAKQAIGKGKPVLLEVGSTLCRACRKMGQLLSREKERHPGRNIFFIDVGTERGAAHTLRVQMIPTQIVYNARGEEIDRHIGGLSADELETLLAGHGF